jgi:hypothetical protein
MEFEGYALSPTKQPDKVSGYPSSPRLLWMRIGAAFYTPATLGVNKRVPTPPLLRMQKLKFLFNTKNTTSWNC